jgi:hypothetical protein
MRKLFLFILWLFVLTSVVSAGSTTTNYSLYKPSSGETGWATLMNASTDTIDTQMKANADDGVSQILEGEIPNDTILEADLKAVDTANDEECLTYETTTGDFEWQVCSSFLSTDIDTYSELNTLVADVTVTHNGLIDTYAELNTIVADQTITHNGLIDTFAEIDAIVADKSLVNLEDGGVFTSDVDVPDDAYAAGWNGDATVPTKNAVYDKIETISASSPWTDAGTVLHPDTATDDVAVGGTDSTAPVFIDESNETIEAHGGFIAGDGTANDQTIMVVDLDANQTISWDDTNSEFDFSAPINASGTGQSALNQGLVINDGGGATDDDDLVVETDTVEFAIFSDASADTVYIGNYEFDIDQAVGAGQDNYVLTYDNGDGQVSLEASAGGGGGDFTWVLEPQQAKLPSSNPMAIDAGNDRWRGLFDDTTSESATWETVLQPFTGTLKAKIYYTMASATTSKIVAFDLKIDCFSDGDAADFDTPSWGTVDSIDSASQSLTAGYLDVLSDASLNGDSCAEYDTIVVHLSRDVATDTAGGDVELRKVLIYAE